MIDLDYSVKTDSKEYTDLAERAMDIGSTMNNGNETVRIRISDNNENLIENAIIDEITLLGIIVEENENNVFSGIPNSWALISIQRKTEEDINICRQLWKVGA